MTMDENLMIEFKGRHDSISARMQENALKKLGRLSRYSALVTRIEVVADNPHEKPEVELIVHLRGGAPLVAKDTGETFSCAIDALVDKMDKQLHREKDRRFDHKGAERAVPPEAGESTDSSEETYEDVVRKTLRG
jgi:ribosomal subunit interface protein